MHKGEARRCGGLAVLLGLLVVGACTASSPRTGSSPSSAPSSSVALAAGHYSFDLTSDGRARSYLMHVPPQASAGKRLPLVMNLHGANSDAVEQEAYSQMDANADQQGYLAVYPNGTAISRGAVKGLGWNAGDCCALPATTNVDDVGFLRSVISDVARRTPVDQRRVYATGMSNGGMMAHRLADQASEQIAAAASVAGQVTYLPLHPARPVPIMELHSVDDPYAKWDGFNVPLTNQVVPPVMTGIDAWVSADGCPSSPHNGATLAGQPGTLNAGLTATPVTYGPCTAGTRVILWRFTGSGHVWPGDPRTIQSNVRGLGRPSTLVDADEAMWQFFSQYHLSTSR